MGSFGKKRGDETTRYVGTVRFLDVRLSRALGFLTMCLLLRWICSDARIFLISSCTFMYQVGRQLQFQFPEQRVVDVFDSSVDECLNGFMIFGPCLEYLFPQCEWDEMICYNRRPRKDKFYSDNRQPYFYIDYRSVFCYPATQQGCSSCSPGRFCRSENRCILEDRNYPCSQWL